MAGLFAFIFLLSLLALPIGLIKPDIFYRFVNTSRKRIGIFFGALSVISFILTGITAPPAPKEAHDTKGITTSTAPTFIPTATSMPTEIPTATQAIPSVKLTSTPTPTIKVTPTKVIYIPPSATPQILNLKEESGGYACNCAKTCSNLSCSEAQYQLNSCGCSQRDADNDGIACDAQCQ